jgi:hypothetical protein
MLLDEGIVAEAVFIVPRLVTGGVMDAERSDGETLGAAIALIGADDRHGALPSNAGRHAATWPRVLGVIGKSGKTARI